MDVWSQGVDLQNYFRLTSTQAPSSVASLAPCTCSWMRRAARANTRAFTFLPQMCVSHTKIITLPVPSRTGRKCSIHLDLSIVTILITPECCQPAKLGGEYRFSPANWLIAMFKGAVFPPTPISYFATPLTFSFCMLHLRSVKLSPAGRVVLCAESDPPYFTLVGEWHIKEKGAYCYCRAIGDGWVQGKGCSTSLQPLCDS